MNFLVLILISVSQFSCDKCWCFLKLRKVRVKVTGLFRHAKLTMAVTARGLYYAVVLVIAHHGLVTISLAALLDVTLDLHAQLTLHAATLRQDTVRPVAHRLGIVFVTWAVLGLAHRIHLMIFTLVLLFAPPCKKDFAMVLLLVLKQDTDPPAVTMKLLRDCQ